MQWAVRKIQVQVSSLRTEKKEKRPKKQESNLDFGLPTSKINSWELVKFVSVVSLSYFRCSPLSF